MWIYAYLFQPSWDMEQQKLLNAEQNIPQVSRFIGNRWQYHVQVSKGHPQRAQWFKNNVWELFTTLWNT